MIKKLKFGSTVSQVQNNRSNVHLLLIPGGPGIESQYLAQIVRRLRLDVNVAAFDLPRPEDYPEIPGYLRIVNGWKEDLLEAVTSFEHPIVVGHSFGGMLALSVSELQRHCKGAIFLDSSPNKGWEKHSAHAMTIIDSSEATKAEEAFAANPSDAAYMHLCLAWAPFYFLPEYLADGKEALSTTTYNALAYQACGEFFRDFECAWKDWTFPTLCLAGSQDLITPLSLFRDAREFHNRANVDFAEIANAGHFPWIENFEKFVEPIRRFSDKFR